MQSAEMWAVREINSRSLGGLAESIDALLENRVAALSVKDFIPHGDCENIATGFFDSSTQEAYKQSNVAAKFVGVSAALYAQRKDQYFKDAEIATRKKDSFFASVGAEDPSEILIKRFNAEFGYSICGVADEEGKAYFHGIVRAISRSPLHNDFAKRDFVGWRIGEIDVQLAWNVYLRTADSGGETVIYDRFWTKEDEAFKHQTAMGYAPEIVEGCRSVSFAPSIGECLIFKCTNYHEVRLADDMTRRLSMGGFMGRIKDEGRLICWS